MSEMFLYGAEVQGIQSFIFSTNELKEIVGASELVEEVCTTAFTELLGKNYNPDQALVMAAGKIRYLFTDETKCQEVVKKFPRKVIEMAPGITFSQAVVKYNGNDYKTASQALEDRLKSQRNNQFRSPNIGFIGTLRSRKTGLPAVEQKGDGEYYDDASIKKLAMMEESENSKPHKKLNDKLFGQGSNKIGVYDISHIPTSNNWIAIIHADGNGLGQVVQKIGGDSATMKLFSKYLDEATQEAARRAYANLKIATPEGKREPIRPIVLDGDDLTVICRAEIALPFVKNFLREFENCTGKSSNSSQEGLGKILKDKKVFSNGRNYLTACAGIAYIKSSYPFYYGYNLAEELCSDAKKESKEISGGMENLPPSSVTFHRVQSSFVESFDKVQDKELTADTTSLKFGPYYLDMAYVKSFKTIKDGALNGVKRWNIDELESKVELINGDGDDKRKLKSNLRDWLTLLGSNPGYAKQRKERIISQLNEKDKDLSDNIKTILNMNVRNPLYDILTLSSIKSITNDKQ